MLLLLLLLKSVGLSKMSSCQEEFPNNIMNINQHHDNNKVAQSMIMNYNKHFFTVAIIIGILRLPTSEAFTVSIVTVAPPPQTQQSVLRYRNYDDIYQDDIVIDANGDRRALQLLEQVKEGILQTNAETMPRIRRASIRRSIVQSPIIPITNIQDYQKHVLHKPNQLCIIRFSAPWCKVCRSTQTAYERLATKVMRLSLKPNSSNDNSINNKRIQFFTVRLDKNNDNAITKLMHMLQIKKVPQGIIHHPTQCLFGHKVDMNRSNISILKQQLERYLLEDDIKIDAMMLNGKM